MAEITADQMWYNRCEAIAIGIQSAVAAGAGVEISCAYASQLVALDAMYARWAEAPSVRAYPTMHGVGCGFDIYAKKDGKSISAYDTTSKGLAPWALLMLGHVSRALADAGAAAGVSCRAEDVVTEAIVYSSLKHLHMSIRAIGIVRPSAKQARVILARPSRSNRIADDYKGTPLSKLVVKSPGAGYTARVNLS